MKDLRKILQWVQPLRCFSFPKLSGFFRMAQIMCTANNPHATVVKVYNCTCESKAVTLRGNQENNLNVIFVILFQFCFLFLILWCAWQWSVIVKVQSKNNLKKTYNYSALA